MNFLGNIVWLVFGGLIASLIYFLSGLLICITIVGIPFGVQLFKFAGYALWPFGREVVSKPNDGGCLSLVMNALWIVCGWWELALTHASFGLILCITIVGIPFGVQHFKMALLSIFPFGKEIR